jgi:hypothetical protein
MRSRWRCLSSWDLALTCRFASQFSASLHDHFARLHFIPILLLLGAIAGICNQSSICFWQQSLYFSFFSSKSSGLSKSPGGAFSSTQRSINSCATSLMFMPFQVHTVLKRRFNFSSIERVSLSVLVFLVIINITNIHAIR